jgi:PAS domain S-box-containing protein
MVKGVSTNEWLQRDRIQAVPHMVSSPLEALQAVSLGRADAYVGNLASLSYQIEREGLANLKVAAPTSYGNYDLHFAVRSDWPEFVSILNKALASITPEEHSAIRQRWIAVRYEYGIDPAALWRTGALFGTIFIVVVSMILLWNWQVHRSEERFRGLLEYGADIILACKADQTIIYQSPSLTPILGYGSGELLHTPASQLLHEDDRLHWQHTMTSVMNGSATPHTLLHRLRHHNGHYLYVESHCINLLSNPAVKAIVINARDLTEHITTEQALQEAKEAAEAANVAKSMFLANMSHELRTPLNAILGFSQLLVRDPAINAEQREHLNIINHSGEHLLSLISDILNMSKIEAGRMTLHEENIDLYQLLEDIEDMFRLPARQKGLLLRVHRASDVPQYLRTDAMKLRQVLTNLLSNAFKFTDKGSVTIRVTSVGELKEFDEFNELSGSSTRQLANSPTFQLFFEVEDTGVGIANADLEKLFEPFVQTSKNARKVSEGTGLGLPISQRFVQILGGKLTVTSTPGEGTVFRFQIQALRVDAETVLQGDPSFHQVIGLAPDQPVFRILAVDDQWESRQLLLKLLGPLGFQVKEAQHGQEALEIFQQWRPHLIWMDMRMPVMDGYKATKRIRELDMQHAACDTDDSRIQTKIIALTASSFEEERAVILRAGCDDFLRKPFREMEIFGMLHKHLGVRFLYKEEAASARASDLTADNEHTLDVELSALPEALLTQFCHAVERIDLEETHACIAQIKTLNPPLAATLTDIVRGYRFDVLQRLFENVAQYKANAVDI